MLVASAAGTFVALARDLSRSGVSVLAPRAVAIGTELTVTVMAPGRSWETTATVVRCAARPSRTGFDTWVLGMRFERQRELAAIAEFQESDAA